MKITKILLTGGSGRLGKGIIDSGLFSGIIAPSRQSLDITKIDNIRDFFSKNDFNVIIHCAALARMKECQEYPSEAIKTNIIGTSNLVECCIRKERDHGKEIRFIHISTDGVYAGTKGNYSERDVPFPYNTYGWTKLAAECPVSLLKNYCIIRTSFFDPRNINFEESATDSFSSKVPIDYLVQSIKFLMESGFIGVINVGSKKKSDYERYSEYKPSIKKTTYDAISKKAGMPIARDASMDCSMWNSMHKHDN